MLQVLYLTSFDPEARFKMAKIDTKFIGVVWKGFLLSSDLSEDHNGDDSPQEISRYVYSYIYLVVPSYFSNILAEMSPGSDV